MSRGPRRLKDDPDFQWETGCDIAEEAVLTRGYDLTRLRAAVLDAAPVVGDGMPMIRPRRAWRWWMTGLIGLSTTVAAFWMGTQFDDLEVAEPANEDAAELAPRFEPARSVPPVAPDGSSPPREAAAPEAAVEAIESVSVGPAEPRVRIDAPSAAVEPSPEAPPTRAAIVDPTDGVAAADNEPAPARDEPRSQLAAEMAVYVPAADALESGDSARAADGFRDYLTRFPTGTLRPEAELGLLWALHDIGDASRTERLAASLQDAPAHVDHRDDIRELRAQALARLGRCEAALETIEGLPGRVVGPIRRACRGR